MGENVFPIGIGISIDPCAGALEDRLPFGAGISLAEPAERKQVYTLFIIQLEELALQAFARG